MASCLSDPGESYVRGNLTIFFTPEMKSYCEPLADYFEENNLIFDHEHSVQLTSTPIDEDGGSIVLKMIASEDKSEIPADEMVNIDLLEKDLTEKVFDGANFRIAICNANFVEYERE